MKKAAAGPGTSCTNRAENAVLNRKIKDRPTEDEGGGGHVAYSPGLVGRACGYVEGEGEGKRKAAVQVAEERCRTRTEGVPTSYFLPTHLA